MKKRSVEFQIKLKKTALIVLAWSLIGVWMTLYEHSTAGSIILNEGGAVPYHLANGLLSNLAAAVMGALSGGVFLVFYVNEKFRDRPYGYTLLAVAGSFVVVVSVITLVLGFWLSWVNTGKPFGDPVRQVVFQSFVFDTMHLKNMIFWAPAVMLTQFTLQINDKFGQGLLWDFLWGKYNVPREEERIFMFVDLQSSTTIAERLGHKRYHLLLRDYFADLTDPVLYSQGEIYQYVGDEMVVSWKLQKGLHQCQCLRCFFEMRQAVQSQRERYESRYGLVPEFKAGLHFGKVIAGEIGIIKKDITYSGDVLNTAARIQSKCNEHGVKLLLSNVLLERLPLLPGMEAQHIGDIELRGKGGLVGLSTVRWEKQK